MATFPTNDKELIRIVRDYSKAYRRSWILPWVLFFLLGAAGAFEWFYSPVEKSLGRMMYWTSSVREETGRGWDLNKEGEEAFKTLSQLAQATRQRQQAGAKLSDWSAIPTTLDTFEVTSIAPQRFMRLYELLPPALQMMLIDPVELLQVRNRGDWQRVFFQRVQGDDFVYFVNNQNIVLLQTEMTKTFIDNYNAMKSPVSAGIEDLSDDFMIVDAGEFFGYLAPRGVVALETEDLSWISALRGKLLRVGMESEVKGDVQKVVFETERESQIWVSTYWLRNKTAELLVKEMKRSVAARKRPEEGAL